MVAAQALAYRDEVVPCLRAAGHGAHPLTLSGLADKRGVLVVQKTHVQDKRVLRGGYRWRDG